MKFMMNGAITLGTSANIEIKEQVGIEKLFLNFSKEVLRLQLFGGTV